MYESIKYEDLKQLPDDQKKEALQELMTTYGSNKAIAEATGAATIAIANLYGKIVEGKQVGRKKGSKNSIKTEEVKEQPKEEMTPEVIVETPNNVTENKPKRHYTRKVKEDVKISQDMRQEQDMQQKEIIDKPIILADLKSISFTTSLCGNLSGEQIKQRVTGMINSLLDDKEYTINLQINEQ